MIQSEMSRSNSPRRPSSTPRPRSRRRSRAFSGAGLGAGGEGRAERGQGCARTADVRARLSEEAIHTNQRAGSEGRRRERLADEEHDNYLSAEGAVHSAEAGIETAAAKLAEANAKVEQAKADLKAAHAGVKVSKANLDLAKVFVQYTKILSPYDGVVIFRGESVHPGTFIRSAAEGTSVPLLTVGLDDKMRTIVLVPDRDVPYCKVGDPATVQLDAWRGGCSRPR